MRAASINLLKDVTPFSSSFRKILVRESPSLKVIRTVSAFGGSVGTVVVGGFVVEDGLEDGLWVGPSVEPPVGVSSGSVGSVGSVWMNESSEESGTDSSDTSGSCALRHPALISRSPAAKTAHTRFIGKSSFYFY